MKKIILLLVGCIVLATVIALGIVYFHNRETSDTNSTTQTATPDTPAPSPEQSHESALPLAPIIYEEEILGTYVNSLGSELTVFLGDIADDRQQFRVSDDTRIYILEELVDMDGWLYLFPISWEDGTELQPGCAQMGLNIVLPGVNYSFECNMTGEHIETNSYAMRIIVVEGPFTESGVFTKIS